MVGCAKDSIGNGRVVDKKEWKSKTEFLIFLRHKKAYQFAVEYCRGKHILDYGCGSGYGAWLLSKYADTVIGADVSRKAIDYCNQRYKSPNLSFQNIDPRYPFPFEEGTFDLIVSFQTIEHIAHVQRYLAGLKKTLKQGGMLFITTPNRNYRLLSFQKPWNPRHKREYDLNLLKNELSPVFKKFEIMGICGSSRADAVERERVRPFKIALFLRIFKPLNAILSRLAPARGVSPEFCKKYTVDDFIIGDKLKKSLDFFAICYKE